MFLEWVFITFLITFTIRIYQFNEVFYNFFLGIRKISLDFRYKHIGRIYPIILMNIYITY